MPFRSIDYESIYFDFFPVRFFFFDFAIFLFFTQNHTNFLLFFHKKYKVPFGTFDFWLVSMCVGFFFVYDKKKVYSHKHTKFSSKFWILWHSKMVFDSLCIHWQNYPKSNDRLLLNTLVCFFFLFISRRFLWFHIKNSN